MIMRPFVIISATRIHFDPGTHAIPVEISLLGLR
jgi:hypothetical protein